MSLLSDAVSSAVSQINVNTKGQVSSVISGVKGAVQNAKNTAVSSVTGAVSNTVKTAVNSVVGAAGDLLTGNVSGALNLATNFTDNIGNSFLSGLGGFAGINSLNSPPGTTGSISGTGGVDPGNNLPGILARPDPMLSFTWYAQLPVISPGTTQSLSGASSTSVLQSLASNFTSQFSSSMGGSIGISNSAQLPWYYVEEAGLPFRHFESKSIFREGRDRKYPSKYNVDDLRLSIYMDSQNVALTYLQAWNNALITPFGATNAATSGGGWGRPTDYKKPIFIYMLDVQNNVLALIEYTECWPTSIDSYSLDSTTSTRVVNHVNFSVGDVFINLMNVSQDFTTQVLSNPLNNSITTNINSLGSTLFNNASNLAQRGASAISSAASSFF